jgi:hypothetical protein
MNNAVSNNPAHHRCELNVDGHIAATYYKITGGVITFIHTDVPPELGGKGIGSRLIKGGARPGAGRWIEGDRGVPVRKGLHRKASRVCGPAENLKLLGAAPVCIAGFTRLND